MVDLIIDGQKARTVGKPPSSVLSWYRTLEGRKSFGKDETLTFENTGSNIELWQTKFPNSKILDEGSLAVFEVEPTKSDRPKFEFKREPLWWQAEAFEKFKKVGPGKENPLPCFAFLYDPGGGKSKSLTDAMCYLWCNNQIDAAIIVAPNDLVAQQWPMSQLPRDVPDNVPATYWKWDKTKKGEADYEAMKAFDGLQVFCLNIDAVRTPRGMKYLTDFIKHHKGRIMFATDESHLAANHSSQRHKALDKVMGMCDWRAILTGTLISKNLINAWAQFRLLHPNILGYKYMSSFRSEFCVTKFNGFAEQVIGHKNIDKFYKLIEPYSYRISKGELGYDKLFDEFEFTMDKKQKEVFSELKKQFMTQLDNGEFLTVSNALSATVKMQQASNGFLQLEDGTIQLLSTSRLDALDAWLETMPEDEKIVIWCRFLPDAKMIIDHWSKKGKAVEISGNVTKEVRQVNKERFVHDTDVLYAVATPDSAGTGTDGWQEVCNRGLFYSSSYNSVLRRQSEDRTSRVGGETTSFYTDLICKGGVDRKILNVLKGVADLSKYTLDDVRREFST